MSIPTVDLSPFLRDGDEEGKKKAKDMIQHACSEYGFFQIINHGVPLHLITRSIQVSRTFFALPDEEKLKCSPASDAPVPAGYSRRLHSQEDLEYMLLLDPQLQSGFNVFPADLPDYRDVVDELFAYFRKTGEVIEQILSDCLGLPPDFLKEYNLDRSGDLMAAFRYFPATEGETNGLYEHTDGNCVTFVIQDEVGGLEVKRDGEWIPVVPAQGSIVVNLGDTIQVLSNNKFKSAAHRVVVTSTHKWRHSLAFFYSVVGDKWVEPLPQLTKEIGAAPKYRGFFYKEYQELRFRNSTHRPDEDHVVINISHYAINPDQEYQINF